MSTPSPLQARFVADIAQLPAGQWDALDGAGNPFLRHAFLRALEQTGCTGPGTGWEPMHLVLEADGMLWAAAPVYLKSDSYGEYVFDWAWARAYTQAGLNYYPKLVVAVPFTPVTGPRLLVRPGADPAACYARVTQALIAQAQALDASGVHWLFPPPAEVEHLRGPRWPVRSGAQFHWHNAGYASFEDFLATFTAQKRKKAHRERRAVAEAGVSLDVIRGEAMDEQDWRTVYRFYRQTVLRHGGSAYLTAAFFEQLGRTLGDAVVLVRAWRGGRWIAMALNLLGRDTLYGRYWGAIEDVPGLHFEACYHTAVEWCIAHQISRFEAGAQGEHKLARGFVPVETFSVHWLAEPRFAAAVDRYLHEERAEHAEYRAVLGEHVPYRKPAG